MSQKSKRFSVHWPLGVLSEVERFRVLWAREWVTEMSMGKSLVFLVRHGLERVGGMICPGLGVDEEAWVHLPGRPCGDESGVVEGPVTHCPECRRVRRFEGNREEAKKMAEEEERKKEEEREMKRMRKEVNEPDPEGDGR